MGSTMDPSSQLQTTLSLLLFISSFRPRGQMTNTDGSSSLIPLSICSKKKKKKFIHSPRSPSCLRILATHTHSLSLSKVQSASLPPDQLTMDDSHIRSLQSNLEQSPPSFPRSIYQFDLIPDRSFEPSSYIFTPTPVWILARSVENHPSIHQLLTQSLIHMYVLYVPTELSRSYLGRDRTALSSVSNSSLPIPLPVGLDQVCL